MKERLENNLCDHGGDVLAYLYNEMPTAGRDSFEMHLADCGTCIDDFAELSQSRYPVFEWKQLEFDPMPTPRVVVPFEASVSWFEKLRAAFSFRPGFAFGSLAVFAVLAAITAFVVIRDAGSLDVADIAPIATPDLAAPTQVVDGPVPEREVAVEEPREERTAQDERTSVKPVVSNAKAVKPVKPKATQQARQVDKLPTLNGVEDDEDDSLRLADIFDEIGTSK